METQGHATHENEAVTAINDLAKRFSGIAARIGNRQDAKNLSGEVGEVFSGLKDWLAKHSGKPAAEAASAPAPAATPVTPSRMGTPGN